MSEPIGKEFYDKYKMCEKCFYDWDESCSCYLYRKQLNVDDVLKQIDIMLKNKFKNRKKEGELCTGKILTNVKRVTKV